MTNRLKTELQFSRAWIELDREALGWNLGLLRDRLPKGCGLMPAVKANAYGHGMALVARELEALGVSAFCVAAAQEGAELREAGVSEEILILGYTCPQWASLLSQYRLTQTIPDLAYATALDSQGWKIPAQLKIDTGMRRLGVDSGDLRDMAGVFACKNLEITGAFTHLCAPEDEDFTLAQGQAFFSAVNYLRSMGFPLPKAHLLSSYGLLQYPQLGGDWARVGIALYGMLSTEEDTKACALPLRPVLSLKARVAQVKTLSPGETAGYGRRFRADRETRLATLSVGYGDGLPRSLSCGKGAVLLRGKKAPFAGQICMDQALVDVTGIPGVSPGDTAVVIGSSGTEEQTACQLAGQAGTIANEILSRLGPRLPRVFRTHPGLRETAW